MGKDGAMRAESEETELSGPLERRWDRGVRGWCLSAVVVLFWWSLEVVVVLAGLGLMVALVWV